jgi:hypothetical protein
MLLAGPVAAAAWRSFSYLHPSGQSQGTAAYSWQILELKASMLRDPIKDSGFFVRANLHLQVLRLFLRDFSQSWGNSNGRDDRIV